MNIDARKKQLLELLDLTNEQINKLKLGDESQNTLRDIDNETEDDYIESEEGFRSQSILDKLTLEQQRIQHALSRIESGNYGICEVCNKPISTDRLNALPASTICITCQEELESQPTSFN